MEGLCCVRWEGSTASKGERWRRDKIWAESYVGFLFGFVEISLCVCTIECRALKGTILGVTFVCLFPCDFMMSKEILLLGWIKLHFLSF